MTEQELLHRWDAGEVPEIIRPLRVVKSEAPGDEDFVVPTETYHAFVEYPEEVCARLPDGRLMMLRPEEFEVLQWSGRCD